MHNEEDESWGRYAAACIRQLFSGVGYVRPHDLEVMNQLKRCAGLETARVVTLLVQNGAHVWFFTKVEELSHHTVLSDWECEVCMVATVRQGWCLWVQGALPLVPERYRYEPNQPSH